MVIILAIYFGVLFLVFGKLKLLPWNTAWKSVSAFLGLVIALVVIGALNFLAPTGRVTVLAPTITVTPNVSGTVVEIAVEPNASVKKGDLLFRIDPEPFQTEVNRLQASQVEAQTAAVIIRSDLQAAEAEIDALYVQLEYGKQRRDDIVKLSDRGVNSQFQLQEAVSTIGQLEARLRAAIARKNAIEQRIASQIDGVDSSVVQAQQMLSAAQWKLEQTKVRASEDGVVVGLSLRVGSRVAVLNSALVFVPSGNRVLTGVFSQTGAHALQVGTPVLVAMRGQPGKYFETVIDAVIPGTGEGMLQVQGTLPTISQLLGSGSTVVRLKLPNELPEEITRFGSTGSALLITPNAGPIEPLAKILFLVKRYMNYL